MAVSGVGLVIIICGLWLLSGDSGPYHPTVDSSIARYDGS